MFDITRRYRTIHSLRDHEVEAVLRHLPPGARTVLDYGCHLGHLSFELAIRFDIHIYAVDNFTGTAGDELMAGTIKSVTGGNSDFFELFQRNMREAESLAGRFKGRITPLRTQDFFRLAAAQRVRLDFAFIDSSHREEEADEFARVADLVRPGGILGGHDYDDSIYSRGVVKGIQLIEHDFTWLSREYTWFMKKHGGTGSTAASATAAASV